LTITEVLTVKIFTSRRIKINDVIGCYGNLNLITEFTHEDR